jgi:hypothetical protein
MIPLFANRAAKAGGRGIAKKNVPKLIYFAILIPNVVVKQTVPARCMLVAENSKSNSGMSECFPTKSLNLSTAMFVPKF